MAMGLSHAFETRNRKRSLQAVKFMRTKASGYPSWPGVADSTEGRIHWRRPTAILRFRLQLCGGPYISDWAMSRASYASIGLNTTDFGLRPDRRQCGSYHLAARRSDLRLDTPRFPIEREMRLLRSELQHPLAWIRRPRDWRLRLRPCDCWRAWHTSVRGRG